VHMATRTYEKGDLTVYWDSARCIHTGICLRSLHSVFNLRNRPWVTLDGADAEEIIATVDKCPTGALRYSRAGEAEPAPTPTAMVPIHDGPLLVRGDLRVLDPETGGVIAEETRLALCRCGKSENQPFCDNAHRRTHFTEASHIESPARADATSPADICPPQDFALE
jgi:uncharacterized Fe-S cluster protein YjdI/CDGSH-type Zn-finger protein